MDDSLVKKSFVTVVETINIELRRDVFCYNFFTFMFMIQVMISQITV